MKIREKKQKHTWSVQILEELLQRASLYESDDDGGRWPSLQAEEDETRPYAIGGGGDIALPADAFFEMEGGQQPVTPPTDHNKNSEDKNEGGD